MKKQLKALVLTGTLAISSLIAGELNAVKASTERESCEITIIEGVHSWSNKAKANGICSDVQQGYFMDGEFILYGAVTAKTSNGQQYEISKPGHNMLLTVHTISKKQPQGWQVENGKWVFFNYSTGKKHTGWLYDKAWYFLDSNGYMRTGWLKDNGTWYYLSSSGAMKTGWQKINGIWYLLASNGAMKTGWSKVGNTWYYLNPNGDMKTGWLKDNGTWYYLSSSGAMKTGWLKYKKSWYLLSSSGAMKTGWAKVGNTWYYLNPNGDMRVGWLKENGKKYFLTSSGAMKTGWHLDKGTWYFFNKNGEMATDTIIDGYYVDHNGIWIPEGPNSKTKSLDQK
ncbi:hypothetical protein [Neobacillus sp.]|uniref:hypothetical protein n=1 Tax=Neobacillus sp. TaxID=2675273 RepID=UPI0035B521B0